MEKRVSYTIVGTFVLLLSIALVGFLFWLAKYGDKAKEFDYYYTYFSESVSGLNIESSVKFRGVEVGRVKSISINAKNVQEVEVLLELVKDTPIKEDNFSMLDSQGITGLKYVELKGGTSDAKKLVTSKKHIATIPAKKSTLSTLLDNGESITYKVEKVLDKINTLLNDQTVSNLEQSIENLSKIMHYVDTNKHHLVESFVQIKSLAKRLESHADVLGLEAVEFLQHSRDFEDKLLVSFDKIAHMSAKVSDASDSTRIFFDNMQNKADSEQFDFAHIVEKNMEIFNETLLALKELSMSLSQTVKSLDESPSDILYKSRKKNLGPGEKYE